MLDYPWPVHFYSKRRRRPLSSSCDVHVFGYVLLGLHPPCSRMTLRGLFNLWYRKDRRPFVGRVSRGVGTHNAGRRGDWPTCSNSGGELTFTK